MFFPIPLLLIEGEKKEQFRKKNVRGVTKDQQQQQQQEAVIILTRQLSTREARTDWRRCARQQVSSDIDSCEREKRCSVVVITSDNVNLLSDPIQG